MMKDQCVIKGHSRADKILTPLDKASPLFLRFVFLPEVKKGFFLAEDAALSLPP
jgi:hypothetical protein